MFITRPLAMLGLRSTCQIADNSGGLIATVIDVLNKPQQGKASIGDEIVVVIKRAKPIAQLPKDTPQHILAAPSSRVRRGDVRRAVVIRTKKEVIRADGRKVRFDDNACVLLNQKGEMVASRVFGIVGAEMRKSGRWGKIVSMAPKVI